MKNTNITPFLTFCGDAEKAVNYYVSIFPNSEIVGIMYNSKEDRNTEGTVLNASFKLMGQQLMAMDIEKEYWEKFTWSTSLLINCTTEDIFNDLFNSLSNGGIVMMGPEPVLKFRKVAWVTDKFGFTWQLVWE